MKENMILNNLNLRKSSMTVRSFMTLLIMLTMTMVVNAKSTNAMYGAVTSAPVEDVYILGEINGKGWVTNDGVKMTCGEDGIYTATISTDRNGKNHFCLTKEQSSVCTLFRSRVSCIVDKKTSVISISFEDNDPVVSAIMADTILSRLQQYIIQYRTKKSRIDVSYYEKLFNTAKQEYEEARRKYAKTADASTNVVMASYQSKVDELENDMQLKYSVYQQMTKQLNIARAKLQERMPAFSVIQEASIPLKASSFPRSLMVIGYMILGAILCALWIMYLREAVNKLKAKHHK